MTDQTAPRPPAVMHLNTTQLRPGDVLLHHGMRILLDLPGRTYDSGTTARHVVAFSGKVLNPNDVRADRLLWSFLHTDEWDARLRRWTQVFTGRYTIQGNALARWTVESRCAFRDDDATGSCSLHGAGCAREQLAVSA